MYSSAETLLIGVDGGGTGCRAVVGTARQGVLAEASGGRANATTDIHLAIQNVRTAVQAAAAKAGCDAGKLSQAIAHIGLAGIMQPSDAEKVARALPYARSIVTDDRATAVTGALGDEDGYMVSVGTGTIIAASKNRQFRYVGGWGFHVADQASGAWLGRAALDRALQSYDNVLPHTDLTRKMLSHFQDDPNRIVTFSMSAKPGDYASFAPVVLDAASAGDAVGLELIRDGVDYMTRGLAALGFSAGDTLCLTGGLGPHYEPFLPKSLSPKIVTPKHSAVFGAFQLAQRAAQATKREQV